MKPTSSPGSEAIDVVAGIDIGATSTKYGLVDQEGGVLARGAIPTVRDDEDAAVAAIAEAVSRLLSRLGGETPLQGIGIGAPNAVFHRGTVEHAPNLDWSEIVPLAELFSRFFSVPVRVTNDANAAAMGEMLYGRVCDPSNLMAVTLGTGVGGGFVVDGRLLYGHTGCGGELGHLIAERDGRLCGCGRRGCLEAYASVGGFLETMRELLARDDARSVLLEKPLEALSGESVTAAARAGDLLARECFQRTGAVLGRVLADAVAITGPRVIVVLGGLAAAGDLILEPTRLALEESLYVAFRGSVEVVLSSLPEGDAAILGAAALIRSAVD